MQKIVVSVLAVFMLGVAGVMNFTEMAKAATPTNKEATIAKIEQSINEIKTLDAKFIQMTKGRADLTGHLLVKRPNRMKLTYDNADPFLIADGYDLMFYEPGLDQLTYIGLDASPALLILKETFSFKDERIQLADYQDTGREILISIQVADDPLAGKIVMIFDKQSLTIKGWIIQDAESNRTTIKLITTKINDPLDDSLFEFHRPGKDKYY